MEAAEARNKSTAVMEREVQELSGKVAQQVNEILNETGEQQAPKAFVAYRVPMPGVRYYF